MTIQWKNTLISYGFISQLFHWLVALVIIATFILGIIFEDTSYSDPNFALITILHKSFGILVLILVLFRILWKMINPAPSLPQDTHFILRVFAFIVHWGLYALVIFLPLSGIGATFNAGFDISFFGLIIESPLERNAQLAKTIINAHYIMTNILLAFFLLHILAALKHHYWNRDDILVRMLDIRRPFSPFFQNKK